MDVQELQTAWPGSFRLEMESLGTSAYTVPTDGPEGKEADGTLEWNSTTIVVVEVRAGGKIGLGYIYGHVAAASSIDSRLNDQVTGKNPLLAPAIWRDQISAIRNLGRPGVGAMAVSAMDAALWDLKAKLFDFPLFVALGAFRDHVPIYGLGGFCDYSLERLTSQVSQWVERGIPRVMIKTSRHPGQDPARLKACRDAIGDEPVLMTDSNGALNRKEALYRAWRFREEFNTAWMGEPVSSDDREGLRLLRDQGPRGLDIAAGEYGFVLRDFLDLVQSGAVDCLQADVTRCYGITGLLLVSGLCSADALDLRLTSLLRFRRMPSVRSSGSDTSSTSMIMCALSRCCLMASCRRKTAPYTLISSDRGMAWS